MKKENQKDIVENIKWFSKFSLLDRLKLSSAQQKSMQILRRLEIEGIKKPA